MRARRRWLPESTAHARTPPVAMPDRAIAKPAKKSKKSSKGDAQAPPKKRAAAAADGRAPAKRAEKTKKKKKRAAPPESDHEDEEEEEEPEPEAEEEEDEEEEGEENENEGEEQEEEEEAVLSEKAAAAAARKAEKKAKNAKSALERRGKRKTALKKARGYRKLATLTGTAVDVRNAAKHVLGLSEVKRACGWTPGSVDTVVYATGAETAQRIACKETPLTAKAAAALRPWLENYARSMALDCTMMAYDMGGTRPTPASLNAATRKTDAALDFTAGMPRGLLRHAQTTSMPTGQKTAHGQPIMGTAIGVGAADERQLAAEEGVVQEQRAADKAHKQRVAKRKAELAAIAAKRKAPAA